MDKSLKHNLTSQEKWLRFLFMVFFFVVNYFIQILIGFIAIFQFIFTLIKGDPSQRLVEFGDSLSQFVYQIMAYLTYANQEKPFPFSEWPTHHQKYHPASAKPTKKVAKEKSE